MIENKTRMHFFCRRQPRKNEFLFEGGKNRPTLQKQKKKEYRSNEYIKHRGININRNNSIEIDFMYVLSQVKYFMNKMCK